MWLRYNVWMKDTVYCIIDIYGHIHITWAANKKLETLYCGCGYWPVTFKGTKIGEFEIKTTGPSLPPLALIIMRCTPWLESIGIDEDGWISLLEVSLWCPKRRRKRVVLFFMCSSRTAVCLCACRFRIAGAWCYVPLDISSGNLHPTRLPWFHLAR